MQFEIFMKNFIEKSETKPRFLTTKEVCEIFDISKTTEIDWRKQGILPEPVRLGKRVYYRESAIANVGNE